MPETGPLQVERRNGAGIVYAPNYINKDGGELIGAATEQLLKDGVRQVVLDLGGCALANSVGISYLIEVLESVTEAGGHLAFCRVSPTIAKTLQIMGLLQTASLHGTQEEAVGQAPGRT